MERIYGHNLKPGGTHMPTNCLHICMSKMHFPDNAFTDFIHYSINLNFRTLSSKSGPDMDQGPLGQYLKCSFAQLCPTLCDTTEHTRVPCPPSTPEACSISSPLSWWYHPTISSSAVLFSWLQSFLHQGLFQWVSPSHQVAKVLELQLQHQSFQWIFSTDFL